MEQEGYALVAILISIRQFDNLFDSIRVFEYEYNFHLIREPFDSAANRSHSI